MLQVGMSSNSKVRNSIISLLVQLLCKFIRIHSKIISLHVKSFSSSWDNYLICCASWMEYTELVAISSFMYSLYGCRSHYPFKFMA